MLSIDNFVHHYGRKEKNMIYDCEPSDI